MKAYKIQRISPFFISEQNLVNEGNFFDKKGSEMVADTKFLPFSSSLLQYIFAPE